MNLNFSGIAATSLLGRALRLPLRLIPPTTVLPILQGPLRGLKWVTGSALHGAWLGSYELSQQLAIAATLRPGTRFWDLGAHVGLYTLLAARICGPENVLAIEPLPRNRAAIEKHLTLNRMSNVTVLEGAVGRAPGEMMFEDAPSTSMGRLTPQGTRPVRVYSIDALVAQGEPAPDVIKCDIEGGEFEALQGAIQTLRTHHPKIFLSFHERKIQQDCCALLADLGYNLLPQDGYPLDETSEILATV